MNGPVLQTQGLSVSFGRLAALDGVDLALERGARHALIGPNGAGKTTLVNVLTGMLTPDAGTVILNNQDVTGWTMDARARQGLVRTFQVNNLFPGLTAQASLVLALCQREGLAACWWRRLRVQTRIAEEALHWLDHLGLGKVADMRMAQLPYGQQRLMEIALALACRPRVLLLDEPAAGLPGGQTHAVLDAVAALPADIGVLLIEHDMDVVFRFARTLSVLAQGRMLASGSPDQIKANEQVRAIYLGDPE